MTDYKSMTNEELQDRLWEEWENNEITSTIISEVLQRLHTTATRPEPSRLEMAKDVLCAVASNGDLMFKYFEDRDVLLSFCYEAVDSLLAVAKGGADD